MSAVETVLSALRSAGKRPRKSGGGWTCCCPAHHDRSPSLSISTGSDGRALIKCHAGCTMEAVCGELGLRPADLFEKSDRMPAPPRKRSTPSVPIVTGTETPADEAAPVGSGATHRPGGVAFLTAEAALEAVERREGPTSAVWNYRDASGELVGMIARWDTNHDGKPGKEIRPISRGVEGMWRLEGMPSPRPLYGLPELLAAPADTLVFVVEGEKAADATRSIGSIATTSPHGSKSADKADWSPLKGREVVILPDHDEAGEQYAERVAELARAAGAKSVLVVRLSALWPEMPAGGDMADFVAHHGGDVCAVQEALDRAIEVGMAAEEEPEPEHAGLPRWNPFPYEILPEIPRRFIARTARAIGCDPAFVAMGVLATLAAAIGNSRRIKLKEIWSEPAVLWTVCVGDSGTGKTPGFLAATQPLMKVQSAAIRAYVKEVEAWKQQKAQFEIAEDRWKRRASRRGEDSEPELPPEVPPMPILKRFVVDDITIEALAVVLYENPRGVIGVRDELNGWFASFDRHAKNGQSGADTSKWLQAFNAVNMMVDRKTSIPPVVFVPRAAVSLTGGIQPAILKMALRKEHLESGMAARLVFAYPPKRAKRWTEEDVPPDVLAAYQNLLRDLHAVPMDPDPLAEEGDLALQPRLLPLSPEAKALYVQYYNQHAEEGTRLSGALAAAWTKLEAYTARFALVIHMVRVVSGDPTVKDPDVIDETSMAIGIQLSRWFENEARRVYGMLGESESEREGRELLNWIERRGGTATVREITHGIRAYRGDAEKAQKDLEKLVAEKILVGVHVPPSQKGGRPRFEYRLASITETPALPPGKTGSGSGDTGDAGRESVEEWGSL